MPEGAIVAIQPRLWGDLPDAPVAPWSPPAGVMRPVEWRAMDEFGAVLAWDALAQWASEPNPFYESWYLLPALRGMAGDRVRILRYEVDGELAGLLPVHRSMRYYGHPVPHVANWLHPNGFIGAPLVARGMERGFWRALLGWADRQMGLFLHLGEMPMTGALVEALRHVLGEQGRVSALVAQRNHVMLQSDMSAQDYFEASVSGKKRKEYRRQASRLGELGEVAFVRQRGGQGLAQWAEDFLALEAAGWKGEARSALACAPATACGFYVQDSV
jgi:CelD/BcsL family acetyltransferase involved in cellulose biosynthesis